MTTKKIILFVVIIVCTCLCLFIGYFTVFRVVDLAVCIPKVSRELGIAPDQEQVYEYVKRLVNPGMSRAEVMESLSKVGRIVSTGSTVLWDGEVREGVSIEICLHPLNNILIENFYTKDEILVGSHVIEDSP